jgi:tRNA1(Val) A37 N6-methylase TrmN6
MDDWSLGALTRDAVLRGDLYVWQPRRGYRFTVDPLLLADFVVAQTKRSAHEVCDLGTGCGVLGLVLLRRAPSLRLTAVELQPRLAELARRNLVDNALEARGEVVELDLADARQSRRLRGGSFDWVVSNPPYGALGRGATSPDQESAIARHEVRLPLDRLCQEMKRLLRPEGSGAVIYPASRLDELLAGLAKVGLSPNRLRSVHPRVGEPATRVLLSFHKGKPSGRMVLAAPLIERNEDGQPTAEVARITGAQ